MESEYDVFVRHAGFEQSIGDRAIGSVILNPNFAIDDVEMDC
jgi:hypothetical protein